MWDALAESAPNTSPRADRLLLMAHASFCRCPAASLRLNRSLQSQEPPCHLAAMLRLMPSILMLKQAGTSTPSYRGGSLRAKWYFRELCDHLMALRLTSSCIPAGKVDEVECTGEALPAAVMPAADVQRQHRV